MDPKRLDELSRQLSSASSRRAALQVLAGGVVASAVGLLRREEAAAGIPIIHCKLPGAKCSGKGKNSRCCTRVCKDGACACKPKGRPCFDNSGILCCSGRCRNGECS